MEVTSLQKLIANIYKHNKSVWKIVAHSKESDYNEISKFLRYGEGVKEALQLATTSDTKILAQLLTKKQ